MENKSSAPRSLLLEFLRYVLVGGIAFVVDFSVLVLFKEWIIKDLSYALYIATVMGFMAGSVVNYILSVRFVFLSVKQTQLGKGIKDKILFVLIGAIGLAISEAGMFIGTELLSLHYMFVKIVIVAVVMVWNYGARKLLVFNSKLLKDPKGI